MDPMLQMLIDEFREHRREWRSEMTDLRECMASSQQRSDGRMTKIEVEQGKAKVRNGIFATVAGVLTGVVARLF